MASADGQGTTIAFGTSSFAAELIDISGPEQTRGVIESTHMGTTGAKTFIPTELIDNGSVTATVVLDAANDNVPISDAAETITIVYGGASGSASWAFSGFCTSYKPSASMGERMTAELEIKVTGAITKSAAA